MVAALIADGFRNYLRAGHRKPAEELLVERANMLTLTAPEMTVLVGGMRALNANFGQSQHGVLTRRPEPLTNDFFVNLLDLNTEWKASASDENVYEGRDRARHFINPINFHHGTDTAMAKKQERNFALMSFRAWR